MNHRDPRDERIRAARPTVPELPPDFAASVMARIEGQGLAVLPPQRAVLGVWLRWMAAGVLMSAGVLLVNAFAYELRMNGSLELLHFGGRFLGSFVGGLPYDLLLSALALAGLAALRLLTPAAFARLAELGATTAIWDGSRPLEAVVAEVTTSRTAWRPAGRG